MQSADDLPAKVPKKPKPNNKTKTLAKRRPGDNFKDSASNNPKPSIKQNNQVTNKNKRVNGLESKNINSTAGINLKITEDHISPLKVSDNFVKQNISTKEILLGSSTNMDVPKSREEILAARLAKKNSKKTPKQSDSNKTNQDVNKVINENKNQPKAPSNQINSKADVSLKNEKEVKPAQSGKELNKEKIIQKEDLSQKTKLPNVDQTTPAASDVSKQLSTNMPKTINKGEKTREEILAEREAKKLAKLASKNKNKENEPIENQVIAEDKVQKCSISEEAIEKKPALSKAERRAIQEAQRAAKAKAQEDKQKKVTKDTNQKTLPTLKTKKEPSPLKEKTDRQKSPTKLGLETTREYKVKLFKHLDREDFQEKNQFINHSLIHPAIVQLGEQVSTRTIVGSNARCISFLKAIKSLIQDYHTPPRKEFTRGLEENINNCVQYLHKCRPIAVSVSNAHKAVQSILRHLSNDMPESELKMRLFEHIETYIRDQIGKAAQAISGFVQQKISNGDVILTFSCSSLIYQILEEAHNRKIDFRVIVVDSRPFCEGQELLRKLVLKEIPCTYVLINAVGFIMPEVTKVLMGAHALLANGYVMARTGTAQVALVAKSFNVPVLVCCETHKFSERVQTDAFVYNELGNPDDLVMNKTCKLANWQKGANKILPLNLNYDITPPELVTAVVTEVAILPCTSVPVILRLKPTDLLY